MNQDKIRVYQVSTADEFGLFNPQQFRIFYIFQFFKILFSRIGINVNQQ